MGGHRASSRGGEVLNASRNQGRCQLFRPHALILCSSFCLALSQTDLAILVARTGLRSPSSTPFCQTGSPCGWWGAVLREGGVWLSDTPNRHYQTHDLTLEATPQPLGHTIPVLKRWIHVTRQKATSVLRCTHPLGGLFQQGTRGDHRGLPSLPPRPFPVESPR